MRACRTMSAMVAAGLMIFTRCCTSVQSRRSVEWKIILTVAAAFALGTAVEKSGLARVIAQQITTASAGDPLLSLVVATALTVDTALKQDARGFG